jgi:hypoxanthine phosphoribosyltransferase
MVIGKPLFTVEQIQRRVKELADEISEEYKGKELVVVGILKGAFMFFADLVKYIRVPLKVDFVVCSSYMKDTSTGQIKVHSDIRESIKGKHVLLVEDIADTGTTLNYLREGLLQKGPESVRICALLDKKEKRVVDVPIDFTGFVIPNQFVVGYGLDYEDKFRNLPFISVFRKST